MSKTISSNRTKGIICIILSALGFALMSACVKLAGDLPNFQKVFFRNLVSAIIALYLILKHKGSFTGKKEKINKRQIISILIAFTGALLIIKPTFSIEVIPYLAGIFGALSAASAYTCLRVLGNKEESYTIVFFFSMFSLITILPIFIYVYEPMTTSQLIYLLLAGVFASLGQFGITLAYRYAPAKEISIFDYTNIIFSAILSIFIFNQYPDILSTIGYIVVFSAAFYTFLYNKKLDRMEKEN